MFEFVVPFLAIPVCSVPFNLAFLWRYAELSQCRRESDLVEFASDCVACAWVAATVLTGRPVGLLRCISTLRLFLGIWRP